MNIILDTNNGWKLLNAQRIGVFFFSVHFISPVFSCRVHILYCVWVLSIRCVCASVCGCELWMDRPECIKFACVAIKICLALCHLKILNTLYEVAMRWTFRLCVLYIDSIVHCSLLIGIVLILFEMWWILCFKAILVLCTVRTCCCCCWFNEMVSTSVPIMFYFSFCFFFLIRKFCNIIQIPSKVFADNDFRLYI